ncbi:interferon gamma 1 [Lepisosteus oculatus]|uniref:Interferon gamma-like n=1 Tax=Lepisosteus oculatus TaxID=7918 RepID=W5NH25_LEPOC|nr:PREDICTED: interferon gamma-like [Lepisosteus oculatus]
MNSLQRLLLFCGLCAICFGNGNCNDLVPEDVKEDIRVLATHFDISRPDLLEGGALFIKALNSFEQQESEEKLLLNEILNLYIKIFDNMNNVEEDKTLAERIHHIKIRLSHLKNATFQETSTNLKQQLELLWNIKVNDPVVQRKAVFELNQVLQKAENVGRKMHEKKEKQRRRRQAKLLRRRMQ